MVNVHGKCSYKYQKLKHRSINIFHGSLKKKIFWSKLLIKKTLKVYLKIIDTHSVVIQETETRLAQPIFRPLVLPNDTHNKYNSEFTVSTGNKNSWMKTRG